MSRVCISIIIGLALLAAACGNPRTNPSGNVLPSGNTEPRNTGAQKRPAVSLRPENTVGDQFRTTRSLRVEETTETERYLTESEEITLTHVLRVDDTGRLLTVRRSWESSVTRLTKGYGNGEAARGELDGCTLELTQRASSVDVKQIAGHANVRGAKFLIEGFDTALLPLDPVRESDFWVLEGSRITGLSTIVEAMQYKIDKNKLTCQLAEVTPETARITLDWRLSGKFQDVVSVLEFKGELVFDRSHNLVTSFELKGGRQLEHGTGEQIEISITRRPVNGWLDLDG